MAKTRQRSVPQEVERAMNGFGARLRELRERRGLSQKDLAKTAGLRVPQIGRYERGTNYPTAEKVAALARVLRVTADALLFGDRKGEEAIELRNLKLFEKFRVLDQLPREEQETALRILDGVIAKHELERLADRVRRSA